MLNESFGFTQLPFQSLKNLSAIYETESTTFLRSRFADFITTKGIALISGESGSGKTTAIKYLLSTQLDLNRFKPFFLTHYPSSAKGFLRLLASLLGFQPKFFMEDLIVQIPKILADFKVNTKMNPFFVFDEAQNISPGVLEEIRLLTNINHPPMMIFIAHGMFKERLKLACFQPIRYRLTWVFTQHPLNKQELSHYLQFHLKSVGCSRPVFSQDALIAIFNASKGLPRLINHIAIEALYIAARKNLPNINQDIIDSISLDLI